MREVIEIAQRLEIDYAFFGTRSVKGKDMLNPGYLRGGKYHYETDLPGDKLKRLQTLLEDEYDLIVVAGVDWRDLPLSAKYEILRQAKRGTGLLNSGRGAYADEYLVRATRKKIEVPSSLAAGVPWRVLPVFASYKDADDFLSSTLRASRFGQGRIVTLQGYGVPEYHLISPGFSPKPLVRNWPAWWQVRSDEYKAEHPEYDMPIMDVKLLHYDYYLAFLIKVMLFAAGHETDITVGETSATHEIDREALSEVRFVVESGNSTDMSFLNADFALRDHDGNILATGHKEGIVLAPGRNVVSFPVSDIPAGSSFADLWIRRDRQVLSFGSTALKVMSSTCLGEIRLVGDSFRADETVRGEAKIERGAEAPADLRLIVRQSDTHGRLVREQQLPVTKESVELALPPIMQPLTVYQFLDIDLMSGEQILDRRRVAFTLSDLHLADSIRIGVWEPPKVSYIMFHRYDRYYETGFDCTGDFTLSESILRNYFGVGPGSSFKLGRFEMAVLSNLRFIPQCARITDVGNPRYSKATFLDNREHGKEPLKVEEGVRYPCLNEPKYRELMRQRVTDVVKHYRGSSVAEYMFDQEIMYSSRRELCYCPHCREYFRKYLKREYGGIEALNREYGSAHRDFSVIEPVRLAEAKQNPDLVPLWVDFRLSIDSGYSEFFGMLTDAIESLQPEARTGEDAGSYYGSRSGEAADIWKMSRWTGVCQPYPNLTDQLRVDFALPNSLMGGGTYWGPAHTRSKEYAAMLPWWELFQGFNFFYTYRGDTGSLISHDLSLYRDIRHLIDQFKEIKGGIGKLIYESERNRGGAAVLYSRASIHYSAWLDGDLFSYDMFQNYCAWVSILTDGNLPFRFISYQQLAEGILEDSDFRLLILPRAHALSPAEIRAMKEFVKKGGVALADLRPGVCDGHGKPYGTSPLDEVFGVVQSFGSTEIGRALVRVPLSRDTGPEPLCTVATDPALALENGHAAGSAGGGWPVLVRNTYGKGEGVLLNFAVDDYVQLLGGNQYFIPDYRTVHSPRLLAFFNHLLRDMGLNGPIGYSPKIEGLCHHLFRSGSIRYLGLLQDLPEPLTAYATGTAQPLRERKTTIHVKDPVHIYDARAKRYLGLSNDITTYVRPGAARVFSLMPYYVRSVVLEAPPVVRQGDEVPYAVEVMATRRPEKHVLHISVIDPRGKELRHYARNVACTGGRYAGTLYLALNERPGKYQLRVCDAATGKEGTASITVEE